MYPGLPEPEIADHLSRQESRARYAVGTEFHIGRISVVANTGTYLDAPFRGEDVWSSPTPQTLPVLSTRRRRERRKNPKAAGQAIWVGTRNWGRVD
jgi:hypothetical protein